MIPVLVGLGVAAAGAVLLSDDKPKETKSTRIISENELPLSIRNRMKTTSRNDLNGLNPYVFDKVKNILVEQLGVEAYKVQPKSSVADDLGADSLDIVELIMAFEEEFDIEIPDEKAEKVRTVADVVNLIDSLW